MDSNDTTTRLTAADEKASAQKLRQNYAREAFPDWPNEAGFDGLTEHRGPIGLQVKGTIPAWAAGSLFRTGPGDCKVENTKVGTFNITHWFDGIAHLHRFDILPPGEGDNAASGVRVQYSSRRPTEAFVKDIQATGMIRALSFGQRADPCVGMFSKFMTMFKRPECYENIGVTVHANLPGLPSVAEKRKQQQQKSGAGPTDQGHRAVPATKIDKLFLATDTSWFCEVDPETMQELAFVNYAKLHPELKGLTGPAHIQHDEETGDYYSFNIDFGPAATFRVFQVSAATGRTTILGKFASKGGYIHSFFLTQNYVVVCVPVAHFKLAGAQVLLEGCQLEAWKEFDPSEPCRWYVVDRRHGRGVVGRFESPAGFFFHSVNAFENDEGDVLCDLVWYRDNAIVSSMYYDVLLNRDNAGKVFWADRQKKLNCFPTLVRYRLAKSGMGAAKGSKVPAASLDFELHAPHAGDMPTINPRYACKRHRYVYCLNNRGRSTLFDGLAKVDMETRDVLMWAGPPGHSPGEAIFLGRPGAEGEDDGVLLSVVLDGENKKSYLLCLDARTMTELGRAECEFAIAIGLHGQHVRVGGGQSS
ncbi:uncharacterized protein E0L32_005739 [Thyridium curvatum]|uniref:Carotenoid cleavage dioxygenase 1 n=1 Tax=Thyridium curvatum TaxID=1093900 RepID=A0A507ASL5_9PEZI|nr:uncharacterized protein E0L32_005739 [Thyridium curvatum]TPX13795.1 hypothetical protein E0L32_005739 [Thyridium curvatum]